MDSSNHDEQRRKWFGLSVDIGVCAGLLLAVIAVVLVDRLTSPSPAVDLVFILDQRYAMKDGIDAMRSNCVDRAKGLKSSGVDCRFAVIPFGSQRRPRISLVPLNSDIEVFERQFLAGPVVTGDPPAASSVEAIERALALDFRKDATVLFYLISQVPFRDDSKVIDIASRMDERGITAIVQAAATEKNHCRPIYQNGGRFYSMEGDDLTGLDSTGPDSTGPDSTGPRAGAGRRGQADKQRPRATSLLARLAPGGNQRDPSARLQVKGIFALRTAGNRMDLIGGLGGSQESEMAVQDGLAWLARHQADDGHWSDQGKCEQGGGCSNLNLAAAVAETGLAVLAFQAGGNYYFNDERYSEHVIRGLDWIVSKQRQDGCLFGPHSTWYEHGIATFALAEACAVALANNEEPDPRYLNAARLAVKFIEDHQYAGGGWQYNLDSPGAGDASVTGWQVLALKSALEAKVDVAPATMQRVEQFYEKLGDPQTGVTGYMGRGAGTDLTTAVGLIVQEFILKKPRSDLALQAIERLQQRAAQKIGESSDMYTLYNGTLAMFLARGEAWKQWNNKVRDALVKRQEKKGCARGSWRHSYGRTLDTAWAVLTLEVYYRYAAERDGGESEPVAPAR